MEFALHLVCNDQWSSNRQDEVSLFESSNFNLFLIGRRDACLVKFDLLLSLEMLFSQRFQLFKSQIVFLLVRYFVVKETLRDRIEISNGKIASQPYTREKGVAFVGVLTIDSMPTNSHRAYRPSRIGSGR